MVNRISPLLYRRLNLFVFFRLCPCLAIAFQRSLREQGEDFLPLSQPGSAPLRLRRELREPPPPSHARKAFGIPSNFFVDLLLLVAAVVPNFPRTNRSTLRRSDLP